MAVGQNQWYHFGVGAPPILVDFIGDWDVHWGYRVLTHGHITIDLYQHMIVNCTPAVLKHIGADKNMSGKVETQSGTN